MRKGNGAPTHEGKSTSIYLHNDVRKAVDVVVTQQKRMSSKANRSDVINMILRKVLTRKGLM